MSDLYLYLQSFSKIALLRETEIWTWRCLFDDDEYDDDNDDDEDLPFIESTTTTEKENVQRLISFKPRKALIYCFIYWHYYSI